MVHYFLRISSLSPSPMVSGRSGSSRHVRKPMLGFEKSSDYSETAADVPPFALVQINFCCAGCLVEGCQHPWHPPWRRHCRPQSRVAIMAKLIAGKIPVKAHIQVGRPTTYNICMVNAYH